MGISRENREGKERTPERQEPENKLLQGLQQQSNSTPHKSSLANHDSSRKERTEYTHQSIDGYIGRDLVGLKYHGVEMDVFLDEVFGFQSTIWRNKITNWDLKHGDEFKKLLKRYNEVSSESKRYEPFVALANHIMVKAEEKFKGEVKTRIHWHAMGDQVIPSDFGKRKPDVAGECLPRESTDLTWEKIMFVGEFKKKKTADVGVGSKRRRGEETFSSSKKSKSREVRSISAAVASTSKSKTQNVGSAASEQNAPNSRVASVTQRFGSAPSRSARASQSPTVVDDRIAAPVAANPEVQLANYAMQMLSGIDFREWTIGFLIDEDKLSLWSFDRTCAICTARVKWKTDLDSFIMIILALSTATRNKFGFDNLIHENRSQSPDAGAASGESHGFLDEDIELNIVHEEPVPNLENDVPDLGLDAPGAKATAKLLKIVHRQPSLFGRGTYVRDAQLGFRTPDGGFENRSRDIELVGKIAWQVTSRVKEPEIIPRVRKVDPFHTPALFAYAILDRVLPSDRLREKCPGQPQEDAHEPRQLVLLFSRKYEPAGLLVQEPFMDVFREVVICLRALYVEAQVLHRDISVANLMCFKEKAGTHSAILNDYDLAIIETDDRTQSSRLRSGTAPYMARALMLRTAVYIIHCFFHDLESLFYVLLFIVLGYTLGPVEDDPLRGFRGNDWPRIAEAKNNLRWLTTLPVHRDHEKNNKVLTEMILFFVDVRIEAASAVLKADRKRVARDERPSEKEGAEIEHETCKRIITWRAFATILGIKEHVISKYELPEEIVSLST